MIKCQQCRDKDVELLTRWERIKNWLFYKVNYTFFADDFEDLRSQKYTQGYSDGIIQGKTDEKNSFERYQAMFTVDKHVDKVDDEIAKLLSPVDLRKVVTFDDKFGFIYINGEKADEVTLANLKSESEALKNFSLWGILNESIKELAQKAMFREGDSIEQMRKGRTVLYTLDSQNRIINILSSYNRK